MDKIICVNLCHLWVLIHSPTDSTDFHGFSRNKFSDFQILNFSDSKNILADNLQYVEIKIISVKFAPIRGQNNLCQSVPSVGLNPFSLWIRLIFTDLAETNSQIFRFSISQILKIIREKLAICGNYAFFSAFAFFFLNFFNFLSIVF